jgi:hypothetical protein
LAESRMQPPTPSPRRLPRSGSAIPGAVALVGPGARLCAVCPVHGPPSHRSVPSLRALAAEDAGAAEPRLDSYAPRTYAARPAMSTSRGTAS